MINLRKYKNLIYLILIFSLIIFTFSLVTSIVITDYKNANDLDKFKNSKTTYFKFDDSSKISIKIEFENLLNILEQHKTSNIYVEFNPIPKYLNNQTLFGRAVYYNYNIESKIPIIEGNNFTLKQMDSNEKLILVGKNLKKYIVKEDEQEYFTIDDVKYKVIGILGDNEKKTGYDNIFLVNMKSMAYHSDGRGTWNLNISSDAELKSILTEYKEIGIKNNSPFQLVNVDNQKVKINVSDILDKYIDFINIFGMVLGLGMLNLIMIVYFWMNKSVKEIGIRKAYGATNYTIAKYIFSRYELSVMVAVVLGTTFHLILKKILNSAFSNFSFEIYWGNLVIITLVFMIMGALVAIIPLIKARKVQPVIIMKGRLK